MRKEIIIALLICLLTGCLFGCRSKEIEEESNIDEQISLGQTDNQQNSHEQSDSNKEHSIEVTDFKEIISKCPKSAKAGNKVTIKTNSFMDALPRINVNGNDIGEWDKNKTAYTFIMPDEDVKITTSLKSTGM